MLNNASDFLGYMLIRISDHSKGNLEYCITHAFCKGEYCTRNLVFIFPPSVKIHQHQYSIYSSLSLLAMPACK